MYQCLKSKFYSNDGHGFIPEQQYHCNRLTLGEWTKMLIELICIPDSMAQMKNEHH